MLNDCISNKKNINYIPNVFLGMECLYGNDKNKSYKRSFGRSGLECRKSDMQIKSYIEMRTE